MSLLVTTPVMLNLMCNSTEILMCIIAQNIDHMILTSFSYNVKLICQEILVDCTLSKVQHCYVTESHTVENK